MKLKNTGIAILGLLFCTGNMVLAGETKSVAPAEVAKNMLANGGFENPGEAEKQVAEGWWSDFCLRSGEQKHGGKVSLKLPVLADDGKKSVTAEHFPDVDLFNAGDEVEFSLYAMSTAKLGAGSIPRAWITFTDANWKQPAEVQVVLPSEPIAEW